MRIIIITQRDPFHLANHLDYLFSNLPGYAKIVGCVVLNVSPFGKKMNFIEKTIKTLRIFGLRFFLRFALRFIFAQLIPSSKIHKVLQKHDCEQIILSDSINSEASRLRLREMEPDLFISVAGNEIFRKPLLDIPPLGCLNLHTALLPKYRGLMPSFWVLKNGEQITGVSVFFVDEGIDSGPILVQRAIEIEGMTQEELIVCTKRLGMVALLESIKKIHIGETQTQENSDEKMTYYGFPTKDDVKAFRAVGGRFY